MPPKYGFFALIEERKRKKLPSLKRIQIQKSVSRNDLK